MFVKLSNFIWMFSKSASIFALEKTIDNIKRFTKQTKIKQIKMNTVVETGSIITSPEQELQELNTKLRELAPRINKRMRAKWALDNFTSAWTVDRYFKGEAKMISMISTLRKLYADMTSLVMENKDAQ